MSDSPCSEPETQEGHREARTSIAPLRDIIVGLLFVLVVVMRFVPPFNITVPATGLWWYAIFGLYGLYRILRGIIKFGSH